MTKGKYRSGRVLVVAVALAVTGPSVPLAVAQQASVPAPPDTFVPATTPAPGGPAINAGNLGQKVQPPPAYVGNRGYQVPPTAVVPSYGNYVESPAGGYLRGAADLTAAQGQYLNDVQSARIAREQSYQASMDTRRKQIEFEQWYETVRPTAPKMLAKEKATDIDWARNHAQNTEIWSGRTLNVLYESAIRSKYMFQGPNLPVEDRILQGLNVNDKGTRANGGLLKENKLYWTQTLETPDYDRNREEFTKHWNTAQQQIAKGDTVSLGTLRDLQASLGALSEQLEAAVRDLTPTRWIESNRYLKQLKDGVKALENTRRGKPATYTLVGKARTVAEVCFYLAKNGLMFAPATASADDAAYSTFYLQLRNFELSVTGGQ
jgi:hypothetical protein